MDDLLIPDTWEYDHGSPGTFRTRYWAGGELRDVLPGDHDKVSDRHVGWDGTDLVLRSPDGSGEERVGIGEWTDLTDLRERTGIRLLDQLVAANPAVAEVAGGREEAAEAARETARAERRERQDRMRPIYGWDGDDLVVDVDGCEVARIEPHTWQCDPPGDRFVRLIRRLHENDRWEMERPDLIALVRAHEAAEAPDEAPGDDDPAGDALEAIATVRAGLDALEAAVRRII